MDKILGIPLWQEDERASFARSYEGRQIHDFFNEKSITSSIEVGRLVHIYKACETAPKTNDEWIEKYFESGEVADRKIKDIYNKAAIYGFNPAKSVIRKIRLNYGRTKEQFVDFSFKVMNLLKKEGIECNQEDVLNFCVNTILDSTSIGVKREKEAEKILDDKCSIMGLEVTEADEMTDTEDGVDLIIKNTAKKMIAGIQIKGDSYSKLNEDNISKDYKLSVRNKRYTKRTGIPVLFAYVNKDYQIQNIDELTNNLKELSGYKHIGKYKDVSRLSAIDKFNNKYNNTANKNRNER